MTHMPELWKRFTMFSARYGRQRYLRGFPGGSPFSDWDIGDRYAHREAFQDADVEKHREAARRFYVKIQHLAKGR